MHTVRVLRLVSYRPCILQSEWHDVQHTSPFFQIFFEATRSGPMSVTLFLVEHLSYPAQEVDAIGPLNSSYLLFSFILVSEARHRFKHLSGLRHRRTGFCGLVCTPG